jgi:hypothetical protein
MACRRDRAVVNKDEHLIRLEVDLAEQLTLDLAAVMSLSLALFGPH